MQVFATHLGLSSRSLTTRHDGLRIPGGSWLHGLRMIHAGHGSDLAERALPTAEAIAHQLSTPVHLVTATDLAQLLPVGLMPAVAFNAEVYEEAVTQAQHDAKEWLSQAAARLHQRDVVVTFEVRGGSPYAVIQEIVQPGDIIVLASRGRQGAARLVLGSLADQLVREGCVPVVLVPATDQVQEQVADHTVPVSPNVQ